MTARAARLTMRVMANRTRPLAISASRPVLPDSPNFVAMFAAMLLPPGVSTRQLTSNEAASTSATAIVSPSARPRPSITALISPGRLGGSTAVLIISHGGREDRPAGDRGAVVWVGEQRYPAECAGEEALHRDQVRDEEVQPPQPIDHRRHGRQHVGDVAQHRGDPPRRVVRGVEGHADRDRYLSLIHISE